MPEPRTVEGSRQNNDGNIRIRIDGNHETATEQPTVIQVPATSYSEDGVLLEY